MIKKNEIFICGKTYKITVVNGVRLIDGKTADEFVNTLDAIALMELSAVGRQILYQENAAGTHEPYSVIMERFKKNN